MKKPLVLLIDSNALIHRAYHAYPPNLTTSEGQQINAVFGFFSIIIQVLIKYKPDQVFFAFDSKEKTFRHKFYENYKATRKKIDQELIDQFKIIKDILKRVNINVLELDGYEADDIIGTLSRNKTLKGKSKIVITGDGDLLQLLDEEVKVFLSGSAFQKSVLYDPVTAEKKLGYRVSQIIEYKGLRGDNSDNIPGVRGIGEVTAKKLLAEYNTLEEIFSNTDKFNNVLRVKLEAGQESAFLSRRLATIDTKVPIDVNLQNSRLEGISLDELRKVFRELDFKSLLPKVNILTSLLGLDLLQKESSQTGLFDVDNAVPASGGFGSLSEQKYTTLTNRSEYVVILPKSIDQENCTEVDILIGDRHTFTSKCDSKEYMLFIDSISKPDFKVVTYDSKKLHLMHLKLNLPLLKIYFDIKLAAHLLTAGGVQLDLISLITEFTDSNVYNLSQADKLTYCDKLYSILDEKLAREKEGEWNLYRLFHELEIPLASVLAEMELTGVKLDTKYLNKLEDKITLMIEDLTKSIYDQAGQEFNIDSPKQLGEILFSKLHLPGSKKNRNGSFSTKEKLLTNLKTDFPIVADILAYRQLAKLKSTYTSTLVKQVDTKTGRIHSKFHQDVASTGRLSSTDPNLQNIPVSSDLGQKVRKAFVAEEGKIFLFLDYSQQELRLLAHLSGEPHLQEAFANNTDIHALTASRLLKKPIDEIDKQERRMGKTVNFGIVYGISAFGLSEQLKIDNSLGQKYIDSFFLTYPKVRDYFDQLIEDAKKKGFITTMLGRKKNTSGLNSPIFQVRKAVEREVINFPLQGSAADMIKVAMVKSKKIIDKDYTDFAKLILQIHDELIYEVDYNEDEERLKKLAGELSRMMVNVFRLKVKMAVDAEIGFNLAESKKLLIN